MRSSSLAPVALLACLLAVAQVAVAHFTVFSPAPSRDKQAYPADNRRFWPIGPAHLGEGVLRPVRDCMAFPRGQTATVAAGSTVNFGFEIGNGAAHIGLCTGRIINLDSGAQYPLADQNNCVSNGQNFRAVMPNVACPRCVAKIMVTAVHLGAERPEFYDSCVDLVITGGSAANPAPAPVPPTRPTTVPSPPAPPVQPTTVPNVRPTTTPAAVIPTPPATRTATSAATTTTTTQAVRPTEPQVKPSPPASLVPQEPVAPPSITKTTTTTRFIAIPTLKPEPVKPEPGLEAHPIEPKPTQKPAEPTPVPQPQPAPAQTQPHPQPQPQPPKPEPQPAPRPHKPELPRMPRVKDVKPWWEQGPCKSGAMACGRDGSTLRFCMGGKWIVQAVAQGSKCKMTRDGQVPVIVRG